MGALLWPRVSLDQWSGESQSPYDGHVVQQNSSTFKHFPTSGFCIQENTRLDLYTYRIKNITLFASCCYIGHCTVTGWVFVWIIYRARDKNQSCRQDRNTKALRESSKGGANCSSVPNIHEGLFSIHEPPLCPNKASRLECFVWSCGLCVRATRRQSRSSLGKHATVSCMNTPGQKCLAMPQHFPVTGQRRACSQLTERPVMRPQTIISQHSPALPSFQHRPKSSSVRSIRLT